MRLLIWMTHPWCSTNGVNKNRITCTPCFNSHYYPEGNNKLLIDTSV
jgi:hypothetical protein